MSDSVATKYKVPSALRPLLEAFTRETLRNQPPDLIQFGCIFFHTLQDAQKANPKGDVISQDKLYAQFRAALQQNIANPPALRGSSSGHSNFLPKLESVRSERQGSPQTTSASSRQHDKSAKSVMQLQQPSLPGSSNNSRPETPEALAATKIQAAYRGHFVRNHPEKFGIDTVDLTRRSSTDRLPSADNKKDMKRHSVGGYSLEAVNNSPDDRAATKIQSEIRGYLARKHVEAMKQKNLEAATKIQAHIRGYLTRKKLNDDPGHSPHSEVH